MPVKQKHKYNAILICKKAALKKLMRSGIISYLRVI